MSSLTSATTPPKANRMDNVLSYLFLLLLLVIWPFTSAWNAATKNPDTYPGLEAGILAAVGIICYLVMAYFFYYGPWWVGAAAVAVYLVVSLFRALIAAFSGMDEMENE